MLDADIDDFEIDRDGLTGSEPPEVEDATIWPPLRLAVVSESAAAAESLADVSDSLPTIARCRRMTRLPMTSEPVLIIEDDRGPCRQAPVRRDEYRNLFSRLRSG